MTETISVSVSGSAFALLLYENIKNEYDQDGFLLGNVISKETNKLTDADHRVVNTEHILKIKSAVPCPQQFYFYDSSGKVDIDKIKRYLSSQETEVIGWFLHKRKRSPSSIKLNLREKIIHKQLANYFCAQVPYFSCCLLSAECSNIKSTYSFCQTFVRYNMSKYENLPLHIINLSDPCYTFKTTEPASEVFSQVIKSVRSSGDTEGHLVIKKVQDTLQEYMKKMVVESAKKEQELFKLEQEIKQIRCNEILKREYGTKESDQSAADSEILENGTPEYPENESSENSQTHVIDNSSDNPKRRRGRSRKQNSVQNNNSVSPIKNCDTVDLNTKENESSTLKQNRTRSKANISYSEIAQKRKN
ncbi:hypothetical protein ILUMI_01382 [Ignelater luminosus]|uniref:BRISC complex subunit FAM175B-like n=1 Tax=Ignelater luminosus TaxID=2038154 RepID=A0A8K0DJV7_IGNLU|nr:hypothetical protein ILUMI_01382 [Ignelater luminosus]